MYLGIVPKPLVGDKSHCGPFSWATCGCSGAHNTILPHVGEGKKCPLRTPRHSSPADRPYVGNCLWRDLYPDRRLAAYVHPHRRRALLPHVRRRSLLDHQSRRRACCPAGQSKVQLCAARARATAPTSWCLASLSASSSTVSSCCAPSALATMARLYPRWRFWVGSFSRLSASVFSSTLFITSLTSVQAAYIVAGVAIAIGLCARRQLPGCRDGRADRRGGRGLGQAALHRGCPGRSKQPTGRDVTGSVTTACDAPADRAVPQR